VFGRKDLSGVGRHRQMLVRCHARVPIPVRMGGVGEMRSVTAMIADRQTILHDRLQWCLTHLYGPAVRCKPNVNKWRGLVLRICIRPLHGAFVLLAIMDIRAHPISFSERP
jgi:hypothetical protein